MQSGKLRPSPPNLYNPGEGQRRGATAPETLASNQPPQKCLENTLAETGPKYDNTVQYSTVRESLTPDDEQNKEDVPKKYNFSETEEDIGLDKSDFEKNAGLKKGLAANGYSVLTQVMEEDNKSVPKITPSRTSSPEKIGHISSHGYMLYKPSGILPEAISVEDEQEESVLLLPNTSISANPSEMIRKVSSMEGFSKKSDFGDLGNECNGSSSFHEDRIRGYPNEINPYVKVSSSRSLYSEGNDCSEDRSLQLLQETDTLLSAEGSKITSEGISTQSKVAIPLHSQVSSYVAHGTVKSTAPLETFESVTELTMCRNGHETEFSKSDLKFSWVSSTEHDVSTVNIPGFGAIKISLENSTIQNNSYFPEASTPLQGLGKFCGEKEFPVQVKDDRGNDPIEVSPNIVQSSNEKARPIRRHLSSGDSGYVATNFDFRKQSSEEGMMQSDSSLDSFDPFDEKEETVNYCTHPYVRSVSNFKSTENKSSREVLNSFCGGFTPSQIIDQVQVSSKDLIHDGEIDEIAELPLDSLKLLKTQQPQQVLSNSSGYVSVRCKPNGL